MEGFEPKKLALLRILQVLEKYTDIDHMLTQADIAERIRIDYGIALDRRTVSSNISLLKEAGYEIETTGNGCYLAERAIENSELRLIIDGILSSKHIAVRHSADLIEKLCGLSNKYFRSHIKNIYSVGDWGKTDNRALFLNIDLVDEAIETGVRLSFDYNKYGIDGKLHKTAAHTVSPYQLILHNQRYFLIARNERHKNMGYYRLDKITDMRLLDERATPLRDIEGYRNGLDYSVFATALPYMYTDDVQRIDFVADPAVVDQIVDWFGDNAHMTESGDKVKVTLRASPMAMEFWAMQYLNSVEILSPQSLRDKIKSNISAATEKYN